MKIFARQSEEYNFLSFFFFLFCSTIPDATSGFGLKQGIHPGLNSSSYNKPVDMSGPTDRSHEKRPQDKAEI